jgi:hypothetical protein
MILDTPYAPRRYRRTGAICYTAQCGGFEDARDKLFYTSDELPQGQFLRHSFPARGATMIAWWDRAQGDTRGNCNSCFILKGEHSTADMLEAFPKFFPLQDACIRRGGPECPRDTSVRRGDPYALIEVFVSPTTTFQACCPTCKKTIYETRYPSATETIIGAHRGKDWQPGSNDYCGGSGATARWEPVPG